MDKSNLLYNYKAEVGRAVDGDTIEVDLDLGLGMWLRNIHVQLQDQVLTAEEQVEIAGTTILVESKYTDGFGRLVAVISPLED